MSRRPLRALNRAMFALLVLAVASPRIARPATDGEAPEVVHGAEGEPAAPPSPAAGSARSEPSSGAGGTGPGAAAAGEPSASSEAAPEPAAPAPRSAPPDGAAANPPPSSADQAGAAAPPARPALPSPAQAEPSRPPPRSRQPRATEAAPFATPPFGSKAETAQALRVVLGLTLLAVLPGLLVALTSFLRIIVVLSMLRHAIGMNETPPNTVLTGLALFLTLFTMAPVLQKVNRDALQPFLSSRVSVEAGCERGMAPLREFMVRQTREQDLALMVEISKASPPRSMEDISNVQLIPAFMLSELRAAFQIGFVLFLPFLLIDLVVSSILMSLGMMMMPPTTISLPLKVLMFVLIDGWSLLLKALVGSFH